MIQEGNPNMNISVGLEVYPAYRTQAWVLDHFGCFTYGGDEQEVLVNLPRALSDYQAWVAARVRGSWLHGLEKAGVKVTEKWEVYTIDESFELAREGYEVNAFFRHDWKPLTEEDVEHVRWILEWSRADLLNEVKPLTDAQLDKEFAGERWTMRGILRHVAVAEHWYLSRLGLNEGLTWRDLPKDVFANLEFVRRMLGKNLPGLAGMQKVVGLEGELWSPRKLARRAAWHERDHVDHIGKLIQLL
jgi:hypothetical protein